MSNPYAPPAAKLDAGAAVNDCWRDDKKVVRVYRGSDLPPRCVKCNASVVGPGKTRKIYWHHGAVYLLLNLLA